MQEACVTQKQLSMDEITLKANLDKWNTLVSVELISFSVRLSVEAAIDFVSSLTIGCCFVWRILWIWRNLP
jgi:hypothetical protein